jgi:diguanylate cyclase (GGDEF)-like protein
VERITRWWHQPDHYRWLSSYIASHEFQRFTRYMMAFIVLSLAAVPILMWLSASGPKEPIFLLTAAVVSSICVVMALLWLTRWPSQGQSTAFAIIASLCIAATCLTQSYPGAGMQCCAAFAALAGYVAFFHSSRLLTLVLSIAGVTAVVCAVRISVYIDLPLAASKLIVLAVSVLAVPFSAQVLVHILGVDALRSDTDPLTDLPNRRGFHRSVRALVTSSLGTARQRLAVVMVDLDDFKRINDTSGHAEGDRILVAVGDILRRNWRSDSVIARIGGEEFIVAVVGPEPQAVELAERLRSEISVLPGSITASIGIASAPFSVIPDTEVRAFADALVEAADRAMYKAKRSGGDQVYVVGRAEGADFAVGYAKVSPTASRTTAINGKVPWTRADRALSGADATSTMAAASMGPTPANTSAAPTAIPPELIQATPTAVTTAKKRL